MESERESFLHTWNKEFQTTVKVLKAYPETKHGLKPHPKSKSAIELAWVFAAEEIGFIPQIMTGKLDMEHAGPQPPETIREVIATYEKSHVSAVEQFKTLTDADINKNMKFFVAPKQMGDVRIMDVLWMALMDQIHHRGQFSVYLRLADAQVPSIYGPSADEPWM